MNIVVCIKCVHTKFKEKPGESILNNNFVINSYDLFALEEAVRLKETYGGTITVISMGVLDTINTLKEAKASGADRIILLNDNSFAGSDSLCTAYILSNTIKKLENIDLIICGQQSVDGETAQVGAQLGEFLGINPISYVEEIVELENNKITSKRKTDNGYYICRQSLPTLITVTKDINRPRLPRIRQVLEARRYKVEVWNSNDIDIDKNYCGVLGSKTRVKEIENIKSSGMCKMINMDELYSIVEKLDNNI